jgi:hypothetical protein
MSGDNIKVGLALKISYCIIKINCFKNTDLSSQRCEPGLIEIGEEIARF